MIRWLGFLLIVSGSSAVGLVMANRVVQEVAIYRSTLNALAYIRTEIEYYLTPLDQILQHLAAETTSPLTSVFSSMTDMRKTSPGLSMGILAKRSFAAQSSHFPKELICILCDTFSLLGKQDILAQTRAIEAAVQRINGELAKIDDEKKDRVKTYKTIGICAGLAVGILLV